MLIVDLKRDETAPKGWSGVFSTAQMRMTEEHSFSNVKGPGSSKPIAVAGSDSEAIEFTVPTHSGVYSFRTADNGTALLGWKGESVAPLVLHRIDADRAIPASWEAGTVYAAEDGHL